MATDALVREAAALAVKELELTERLSIISVNQSEKQWCAGFDDRKTGRLSVCVEWTDADPVGNVDRFKDKLRKYLTDRDTYGTKARS